jgi:hypothetical protein
MIAPHGGVKQNFGGGLVLKALVTLLLACLIPKHCFRHLPIGASSPLRRLLQ